jgi:ParB family chromosome partitioning protein
MDISAAKAKLSQVPVSMIRKNPENPRLLFRPQEMDELMESIRRFGIQVPVSLYKDGDRYFLIDGERRWICSQKLSLKTIPALVQEKPDALTNLLLMFNIHSLREQWDLLSSQKKLG